MHKTPMSLKSFLTDKAPEPEVWNSIIDISVANIYGAITSINTFTVKPAI